MRKVTIVSGLTAAFLVSSLGLALISAHAQSAPNPANRVQHHVQFLTKLLSLTSAQQQQATTIFTAAASSAQTIHASLKTARQNLRQAITTNNTAAIDQNATTIGNLTAQMTSTRAKAQAAFYQTLTPDQQSTLTAFMSSRHKGRKGHFKGGDSPQEQE